MSTRAASSLRKVELTSFAGSDRVRDAEDLCKVSASPSDAGSSQETYAASTYDQVVPTSFPYNNNPCEESSSNSKHPKHGADRHGRYDRRFGGVS